MVVRERTCAERRQLSRSDRAPEPAEKVGKRALLGAKKRTMKTHVQVVKVYDRNDPQLYSSFLAPAILWQPVRPPGKVKTRKSKGREKL